MRAKRKPFMVTVRFTWLLVVPTLQPSSFEIMILFYHFVGSITNLTCYVTVYTHTTNHVLVLLPHNIHLNSPKQEAAPVNKLCEQTTAMEEIIVNRWNNLHTP